MLLTCTALAQQPAISDFQPAFGTTGEEILVSGSGFSVGTIKVYFWNGRQATRVVTSDSLLRAYVPSGAAMGPLGIQRDSGPTNYTSGDFKVIGSGPYITGFDPVYGPVGTLVVISGAHFAGVTPTSVRFNGRPSVDASVNANGTSISVHVPSGATAGPISVTSSTGTSNSPSSFTVLGPGPFITGFGPTSGTAGELVRIDGMQFIGATNATFNGVAGANFSVRSATLIEVRAPSGVCTGPISVNSPLGSSTTVQNFVVPPVITNVSPAFGRSGTNVTIRGFNFRDATAVTFNGMAASWFSVSNNNLLVAGVPPGATTGLIRITTPPYSCFSGNNYVILPTVSGFSPGFGPPGTPVTISGANLNVPTQVVRFNDVQAAPPTSISFGQLTAVVPGGATTGPISVETGDGSHTTVGNFFLPASISGFTPTNRPPGTRVKVTGQNFVEATEVRFNGIPAVDFNVTNNTTLGVTVPPGVTTGPITVTTPAGVATSGGQLYYAAPVISGFTPDRGLPGTNVIVSGTNFLGTTAVRFNGVAANITSIENGRLAVQVPNGAQTGPITVEAPAGTNTSLSSFVMEYTANLEIWMSASPSPATVTSNVVYSVTMVNRGPFDAANVRLTNTFSLPVNINSATLPSPWAVNVGSNMVTATITNVASGGTSTMLVNVAPQQFGMMMSTASVYSDSADPIPGNNITTLNTPVDPLALLSIRWWTNRVRVSWSLGLSTNYLLEAKSGVASNLQWALVTNVPQTAGTQRFVIESNTALERFYRLKKEPEN